MAVSEGRPAGSLEKSSLKFVGGLKTAGGRGVHSVKAEYSRRMRYPRKRDCTGIINWGLSWTVSSEGFSEIWGFCLIEEIMGRYSDSGGYSVIEAYLLFSLMISVEVSVFLHMQLHAPIFKFMLYDKNG